MASGEGGSTQFLGRIESLRGLAALEVLIGHADGMMVPMDRMTRMQDINDPHDFWVRIITCPIDAETAVLVFFVISGFVIGRSLDKNGAGSLRDYCIFLARRALRLYPAHIVALLAIVALGEILIVGAPDVRLPDVEPGMDWLNGALNGAYLQGLDWRRLAGNLGLLGWTLNFPAWSLYVELCAAPLLPLFHAYSRRGSPFTDAILVVALVGVAAAGWDHLWCRYWFAFYLGMIVQTHGERVAAVTARALGGVGPALLIVYLVLIAPTQLATDRPLWVLVAEAVASFLLISLAAWGRNSKTLAVFDHHALRWNGMVSYSFYLYHYILLVLVARAVYLLLGYGTVQDHAWPICAATIALVSGLAWAAAYFSYRFVERPGIALGHRIPLHLHLYRPASINAGPGTGLTPSL